VFLRSLPIFSGAFACFKSLTLIHILINQGPVVILQHLVNDNSILADIKDVWGMGKHSNQSLSTLIVDYSNYLMARISFAKKNTNFDGNFSLEKFVSQYNEKELSSKIGKYSPFNNNAANDIVALQKSLADFSKSFLREISDTCKDGCLQELIHDYANLYTINSFVLQSLQTKISVSSSLWTKQTEFYGICISFFKKFSHKKLVLPTLKEKLTLEESRVPSASFSKEKISFDGQELTHEEFIYGQSLMNFEVVGDLTLEKVMQIKGNDFCCDCRSKNPKWTSLTLGVFICQNCCQLHRNLGIHLSKVRSTSLEKWSNDQIQYMRGIGNVKSNRYWEFSTPKTEIPKNPKEVPKFIEEKYIEQKWKKSSINATQTSLENSQISNLKKGQHTRSKSYNPYF
jgi:stromal membrane-associated protein